MAEINTGDTAWMLVSTALVMLMTPGLAFFYGGLVRRKNVLSIMMQCFMLLGVISIQWVLFGYSLAFGPDHGGLIGDLSWAGLQGVGLEPNPDYAATIPHQLFMIFQMMFAVITPALIIGAFAERMKFSAFLRVLLPVGHHRLRSHGPLGLGRGRHTARTGRSRLRRRHSGAHQRGHGRLGGRLAHGEEARVSQPICLPLTTCPSPSWVRLCCGSDGSASTPVAPWAPTA